MCSLLRPSHNLLTFVNMLTFRMPIVLSHLQGYPAAVLRLCYLRKYAGLSFCPLYMLRKNRSESFRPEPFFRPKSAWLGLVVTVHCWNTTSWIPENSSAAHLEVTRQIAKDVHNLRISLSLFGGKSGWASRQYHGIHPLLNSGSYSIYPPPPPYCVTI